MMPTLKYDFDENPHAEKTSEMYEVFEIATGKIVDFVATKEDALARIKELESQ